MFNEFITALAQKITHFMVNHPNFFTLKEDEKEKLLVGLKLPKFFKEYLQETTANDFLTDLELVINYIRSNKDQNLKNNKLFEKIVEFLTTELAMKMDIINSEFCLLSSPKRREIAEELIPGESEAAISIREIMVNYSYQQICAEIYDLCSRVKEAPYILIQSPREIDHELKRKIRKNFLEQSPYNFPIFQINKKLIGGIRIFENGHSTDNSWLSRILRFTSLTSA